MPEATIVTITRHADTRSVLADRRFAVPPLPDPAPPPADAPGPATVTGVAWLRTHVSRFSNGAAHSARRALVVTELRRMSPATLRRRAGERTTALLFALDGVQIDLMARVARAVPVEVLAQALGVDTPVWTDVAAVARAYHPGTDADPAADEAVARLVKVFGARADDTTAARIGLLVQACEATAGLIGNAMLAMSHRAPTAPVDGVLTETLRHDPPVRLTHRVAVVPARVEDRRFAPGTVVRLNLAAANRDPEVFDDPDRFDPTRPDRGAQLTFGAGTRPCPGSMHAVAIAAGVLEALRGYRVVDTDAAPDTDASRDQPASLRVPGRLTVSRR